ncbi:MULTISPECIES: hypothetical protein [Stutzerimonas stutzeri group]|uniref:hypothetical protein n=1 Tax=Stutzerimonas stutzeri group TaxID=136846 RepID=UPI000F76EBEC|nr:MULTISPECIES: hypothetical protein [Stutzerimonas stutzeri group]MDA0423791.1 hypothetical protein [Stutzerimonas frequens]RRW11072.1 hypothetical protein EGJ71_16675 [Stutzerimonas stutzeri]RSH63913.1 hypothetical protein EGV02_18990 [Stutzerimonas stutzeri]
MKNSQGSVRSMLNKYIDRLERLTGEYRKAELGQFEGPGGKKAEFDDLVWYHVDPNTGRRIRYLCGVHGRKGRGNAGNRPTDSLPYPYNHLIKVWIIETTNTPLSAGEKKARMSVVRKLLTLMDGDLYAQTDSTIRSLNLGAKSSDRLRSFLAFCSDKGVMKKIDLKGSDNRDRTGHALFDNTLEKLPDIETVLALGAIFSSVFEHVDEQGSLSPGEEINMHDALVVTFALLSLASPNRTTAEIPLLPKQRLHSYSESNGEPVYYLDWIGSKGYGNNKNHMLAALVEPITKALNFFYKASEPARVLCRFYENPNQSLKALLGEFEIAPVRARNLSLTQQPNLFTLGYALGFYGVDDCVPVLKESADLTYTYHAHRGRFFEGKQIYSLRHQDKLSVSRIGRTSFASLPYLFGYTAMPEIFTDKLTITVGEVQEWWVSFYRNVLLPEFPLSFSNGESSINLKDAMFCFLGSWFYGASKGFGSGGNTFQKTNYMVVPLASLGASVIPRLTGHSCTKLSIFQSYGFSSELSLRPHSLRHLSNTLADLSSIPVEIITAWSGRKSSEQTHTYIHTTHDEKASRVSAILNPPDIDRRDIRVVSQDQLTQTTNLPASVTSTGLCTQNLNVTPCNYLNDFVSQCFMCPETCHIAGDVKTIEFFEKDLSFQTLRLESVACDPRLPNSQAMRQWYLIHSRNTHILSMLNDLMKSKPVGTMIRYSNKNSEFSLTDLNTKIITKVACALPDFEARLKGIIEDKTARTASDANPELRSLLSSFGLSEGEV